MIFMRIEEKAAQCLIHQQKTLAIAESCTGGLMTHRLTNIPGSSKFLKLGLVVYSNEAKTKLLKISAPMLKRYGAVSQETAVAMAKAVRTIYKTDFGVGITGIAGPGGGTPMKPAGLTYIAVSTRGKTVCVKRLSKGRRTSIKSQAADSALRLLYQFLT